MTQPAWLIKWQAREALQNGQPDEALRLLESLLSEGNRRAWALREDVVRGYVTRAERYLRQENIEFAWRDLLKVETIAPNYHAVIALRETLTRLGLAEVRACLETGKPLQALSAASRLKDRPANSPELPPLEEVAQEWILAQEIAERGDFHLARQALDRARRRFSGRSDALDRFEERLSDRESRYQIAMSKFKDSLESQQWRESIDYADEILSVAPQQREIQQSRIWAWQAIQPKSNHPLANTVNLSQTPPSQTSVSTLPKRFYLWVDGVGGFLVCLSSRITFGQATIDASVDIPLLADISRVHASLMRDGESYLLESNKSVQVNGQPIERTILQSGDRLILTGACEFLFHQPMPGCSTIRLDPRVGRRLPMSVNGILMMSDLLVLGPTNQSHIRMDIPQPIYLFRDRDQLGVKWTGEFFIEGEKTKDRGIIPRFQGSITSDCFGLAIEPIINTRDSMKTTSPTE